MAKDQTRGSKDPSGEATPAKAEATPEDSQPTGTYAFRDRILAVTPRGSAYSTKAARGTWRFISAGCDAQSCHGRIESGTGTTKFTYTWDGTSLQVSRPVLTQTSACTDPERRVVPGSSATVRSRFSYAPTSPAAAKAPPERLVIRATQRVAYLRLKNCAGAKNAITKAVDQLVLTRRG